MGSIALLNYGQREPEGRACATLACDSNLPIMLADDGLADVEAQAQAGALPMLDLLVWSLIEALPDTLLLIGRQAWPLVLNRDTHKLTLYLQAHLDRFIII